MIAHLIYPLDNDRWKYHLKWYITAPWALFVAFSHRCMWVSHSSGSINMCGWKLGIRHRWMMLYFFSSMSIVVCQAKPVLHRLRCQSDRVVHPPVSSVSWSWCTEPRSLPRLPPWGMSTHSMCDYHHTIAQVRGVKNILEMQIVPEPIKCFETI